MRVKFCGRYWSFDWAGKSLKVRGYCEGPHIKRRKIKVRSNLSEKMMLDTLIHESIHASFWSADEEAVTEAATDIARFLWNLGYRKSGPDKSET